MAQRSTKVYSADYTELKKQLDAELNRRGKSEGTAQGQSVGSMSAYIQAYTTSPGTGRQIINEHIQKITQPLSAITGSSITPASGSKVAADILTQCDPRNIGIQRMRWCLLRALYYRLLFCLLQLYRFMYGRLYRLVHKKLCR